MGERWVGVSLYGLFLWCEKGWQFMRVVEPSMQIKRCSIMLGVYGGGGGAAGKLNALKEACHSLHMNSSSHEWKRLSRQNNHFCARCFRKLFKESLHPYAKETLERLVAISLMMHVYFDYFALVSAYRKVLIFIWTTWNFLYPRNWSKLTKKFWKKILNFVNVLITIL